MCINLDLSLCDPWEKLLLKIISETEKNVNLEQDVVQYNKDFASSSTAQMNCNYSFLDPDLDGLKSTAIAHNLPTI